MSSASVLAAAVGGLIAGPGVRAVVWRYAVESPPKTACPGCGRAAKWSATAPHTGCCPVCSVVSGPLLLVSELSTATGFVVAAQSGGPLLQTLALCWLAAYATALALIDAVVRRLPDRLTVPAFAGTTVLLIAAALYRDRPGTVYRLLLAAALLGAVYFVLALSGGMGLGDVKLAPALGAALGYFGWNYLLLGTTATFCLGALYAGSRLLLRRSSGRGTMPFGPFMVAGTFAVLLASGFR